MQEALTQRALELLALPDDGPKILLDLGCGSGLSGEELTENGHTWVVGLQLFLQHARVVSQMCSLWTMQHQNMSCNEGLARCRQRRAVCSAKSENDMQGFDISRAMLDVAAERDVEGDLCLLDMGHGMPLRAGVFDGAISISAIQWLCNAVRSPYNTSSASSSNRFKHIVEIFEAI